MFQTQLAASGGSGSGYTFKASGLPGWLTLSSTGLLSGMPPAADAFTTIGFSFTVTDSKKDTLSVSYSLQIDPAITLQAALPSATAGVDYDVQLEASGGSGTGYTFTATGLPSWLTLSSTGVLTGVPPAIAHDTTYSFKIAVTDSAGATDTQVYTLSEDTVTVG